MPENGAVVRVTLKNSGFAQIRTSPGVMEDLLRRAKLVAVDATGAAEAAGFEPSDGKTTQGMAIDKSKGKGPRRRARVSVRTANRPAVEAEATARVLTRAFEKAKG
jgi:hypothetical protein